MTFDWVRVPSSLRWGAGLAVACAALTACAALAGCGGTPHTDRPAAAARPATPAASPLSPLSPLPRPSTQGQCAARPDASGDILVRITTNGQPAVTQQLGGAWTWNSRTHACDTPVQAVISTAPANAGDCTQVAYAASNPGYRLSVSPAPPLRKVVAAKGPAC